MSRLANSIPTDIGFVAGPRKNEPLGVVTPKIRYVEGLLEALVALDDDEKLFRRCHRTLQMIDARRRLNRQARKQGNLTDADFITAENMLFACKMQVWSLLQSRADRLRDVIKPEVKRCAALADEAA